METGSAGVAATGLCVIGVAAAGLRARAGQLVHGLALQNIHLDVLPCLMHLVVLLVDHAEGVQISESGDSQVAHSCKNKNRVSTRFVSKNGTNCYQTELEQAKSCRAMASSLEAQNKS